MESTLVKWRNQGYYLNYGEDCIRKFVSKESDRTIAKVLDMGCGQGRDLRLIQSELKSTDVKLFGIGNIDIDGIEISNLDLECDDLPFPDGTFDLTICNQVMEHLKNWLWAFHEQIRTTKLGGGAIVGFPNLGALHCRVQLLLGSHPSCIKLDSAHVRGFTHFDFQRVVARIPGLEIIDFAGANMYGFPPNIAKYFGSTFPTCAVSIFYLLRKTDDNVDVIKLLRDYPMETNYKTR
jgi:SAM-dependent methyltransferase